MIGFGLGLIRVNVDQKYTVFLNLWGAIKINSLWKWDQYTASPVDPSSRGLAQKMVQLFYEKLLNQKVLVINVAKYMQTCSN